MTKREFIELTKDMPDDADLVYSSSYYTFKGDYKGFAYLKVQSVKHYPVEAELTSIFLE